MNMLRQIRERKGLSVSQLAARASIPTRLIAEYEEGTQPLPLTHAKLLAKALWVGIEDLMPPAGTVMPAPVQQTQPQSTGPVVGQESQLTARPPAPRNTVSQQVYAPASRSIEPTVPRSAAAVATAEHKESQTGAGAQNRPTRAPRSSAPPPGPVSDGQSQELARLAALLNIGLEQLEERIGKGVGTLTRPEAKEWIKRLRGMADQVAPAGRVKVGQWPDLPEDQEATYLREHTEREQFFFKLFNGDDMIGTVIDYTPYTITIRPPDGSGETVLRKLAIAYYRCLPGTGGSSHALERHQDDNHQSADMGIGSDHAGQPEVPEQDAMDDDRGI